ncbi:hypothetical protein HPA02_27100 [Bisbaumannia pacifica]|uniref:Uncharacterized protein n=1 Tax=Bisbaumannia pacifica TaxID=77098 RepID=A0A510XCL1_9GAMM|nr:hypothetical protein [Halomonas pacifica]GEK48427.1 hypothetical protein HPA02_27100 [Halomonas pacifica]
MGWADSATGGGYGGGSAGRGGRDNDRGGYGGGFGGAVDTGGVAPGQGAGLDAGVGRGNGGIGPPGTHTSIPGARNHSAPSDSEIGAGINTGTMASPSLTTRADVATRTGRQALGLYGQIDTPGVVSGDVAAMEAERSFMGRLDAAPMGEDEVEARADRNIQMQARPGLIERGLSLAASTVSPALGMAVDTVGRARAAQQAAEAHNAEFDTNLDTSFSHSLGRQSLAGVGGLLGGRGLAALGGSFGGALGGVHGALAGTLGGAIGGSHLGRSAALGGALGGSAPGAGTGDGVGAAQSPTTSEPPATMTQTAAPSGPIDFDGYASYAQSFFG